MNNKTNDERKDQNTMNYYARKSSGGQGIICDEDTGRTVAVVYDDKDMALLAAAPALLAALEYAMREVESYEQRTGAHQFCHWITTAWGAIAQAKEEG
jgi:hypothetical protein